MKLADLQAQDANREAFLARHAADQQALIAELREELGRASEFYKSVAAAVVAHPAPVRHKYPGAKRTGSEVVPVLCLSDWHIGEVVSAEETDGFGGYDFDRAEYGLQHIVNDFLAWVEINRACYPIRECAVLCIGDYISGDIHLELTATNEFPVPEQVARAGALLGYTLRTLSAHFGMVTAYEIAADNHGRLNKKPQAKQKSSNNLSHLVHVIANAAAAHCKNLNTVVAGSMKHLATINGHRFLVEHGDCVRAWMGIPIYGIQRSAAREAMRRMRNDKGFDYLVMGHWHVPSFMEGRILVNGSLSGTTEYDHSCGRHAAPCQVAFMVHKNHGVFNYTPFRRKV